MRTADLIIAEADVPAASLPRVVRESVVASVLNAYLSTKKMIRQRRMRLMPANMNLNSERCDDSAILHSNSRHYKTPKAQASNLRR